MKRNNNREKSPNSIECEEMRERERGEEGSVSYESCVRDNSAFNNQDLV